MLTLAPFADACREACSDPPWTAFARHPWIEALADGTLRLEQFAAFHAGDGFHVAEQHRALALGVAQAPAGGAWARAACRTLHEGFVADRVAAKRALLAELGVPRPIPLEQADAGAERVAYAQHLVQSARTGPLAVVAAALLPCALFTEVLGDRFGATPVPRPALDRWAADYRSDRARELTSAHALAMQDASGDEALRDSMRSAFARSVALQVAVFDAAWAA